MNAKPRLALTMGDVNGIGPEVLARTLEWSKLDDFCVPVVYGSIDVLQKAQQLCNGARPLRPVQRLAEIDTCEDATQAVAVFDAQAPAPELRPGEIDPAAGDAAIKWVVQAVEDAKAKRIDGLVTGPINKTCIYAAGYNWIGHTELVADLCGTDDFRMCLFAGPYRLIHNTGHMSLVEAINRITPERLTATIEIAHEALRKMGFAPPRIAVAGLNPHAGEGGAFGREEIDVISPVVEACRQSGISCDGPHPPDTILAKLRDGHYDALVALYHDQGHIPVKLVAMDEGVNVTLGIPIVRTSVDHGTAFDIAWKGLAREHSFHAAIVMASQLAGARRS